jgi:hypothetical protein
VLSGREPLYSAPGKVVNRNRAGNRLPLPFTTRMTVIRLSSGDLLLHSPIAFDEWLAAARFRHWVRSAIWCHRISFHYAHIGDGI